MINIVQTLKMIIMETMYKLEKYIWYNIRREKIYSMGVLQ